MKRIIFLILIPAALLIQSVGAAEMSAEEQQSLLNRLAFLTDVNALSAPESEPWGHCGTDIAFEYFIKRDMLTSDYAAKATEAMARPELAFAYDSPGGHFKIHYNTSGPSAAYMPGTDENSDGIPDYINGVAEIADSSWNFEVVYLDYEPPPSDDPEGGDDRVDIYVQDINPSFYGWTQPENQIDPLSATSYIVIDNDYGGIAPYNESLDIQRRLDAARVTIAHEFFHTIHFGMDWTEYEDQSGIYARPWWEMTATWMEDMVYDDVNDYLLYQQHFFRYPWVGLRTVAGFSQHQYAAALFPIFLAERYDTSIVRDIWERCRDYGADMQFGQSINDAIIAFTDSLFNDAASPYYQDSSVLSDIKKAYAEFSIWNYFTGSRADLAPTGVGYEEAASMIEFPNRYPDSVLLILKDYGTSDLECGPRNDTLGDGTPIPYHHDHLPQNLGTEYLQLENLSLLNPGDSMKVVLFGNGTTWGYGFVGLPLNPDDEANMEFYSIESPSLPVEHYIYADSGYSKVIAALCPATDVDVTYILDYCCIVIFEGDIPEDIPQAIKLMAPYPNPKTMQAAENVINFTADFDVPAPGKRARLNVTVFTVAGEKVIEMHSDWGDYYLTYEPMVQWNLYNDNPDATGPVGEEVAPGVYLAYCELEFGDGTGPITKKYKIAVIK